MSTKIEAQHVQAVDDIALELISDPGFSRKQIEPDSRPYRAIVKALQAAYAAGAADENEACAKVADDFIEANPHSSLPSQIASSIRAYQENL